MLVHATTLRIIHIAVRVKMSVHYPWIQQVPNRYAIQLSRLTGTNTAYYTSTFPKYTVYYM
jgi:hypothetical protein